MPTFDAYCKQHGYFEVFFESFRESYPCNICGEPSEQRWVHSPNLDRFAASLWNIDDPQTGRSYIKDKKEYHQLLGKQGIRVKEPGSEKEAQKTIEDNKRKGEEKLRERVGQFMQDHTLDEVRTMLKTDEAIHNATMKGDGNKLKSMGMPTSLEEAYTRANTEQ